MSVAAFLRFVDDIAAAKIAEPSTVRQIEIKFGSRIDKNRVSSVQWDEIVPNVFRSADFDWDIDLAGEKAVAEARPALASDQRTIYRAAAYFEFGCIREDVRQALQIVRPDDGTFNLSFADLSVTIDVIDANGLGGDKPVQVGWIGIGIGGPGYLFPWSPADLIENVQRLPALRAIERVCRDTFPVNFGHEPWWHRIAHRYRDHRARSALGAFYPFSGTADDWAWSIYESG